MNANFVGYAQESGNENSHHVLVVMALKEEFDQLIAALGVNVELIQWKYPYYVFSLTTTHGRDISIAASYVGKMDSTYVSTFTLELLHKTRPLLLVNLGISGLVDDEFFLGDVMVVESCENILYRSKVRPRSASSQSTANSSLDFESLQLGGDTISSHWPFHTVLDHYDRIYPDAWAKWLSDSVTLIESELDQDNLRMLSGAKLLSLPPRKALGPVVTAPWVGADPRLKEWVKSSVNRNILAMDTESWGVLNAGRSFSPALPTLVIRGISDPADTRKKLMDSMNGGAVRRWAMANASHLFASFLVNYWGNALPDGTKIAHSTVLDSQGQLEAEILDRCIKEHLTFPYNSATRTKERGFNALGTLFGILAGFPIDSWEQIWETLTAAILNSSTPHALLVEGLPGTGKTSFLNTLYWYLLHKRESDRNLPLPVFLNLHRYNDVSTKGPRTTDPDSAVKEAIKSDLVPLTSYVNRFVDKPLILIIDGFDEFARYRELALKYLSELFRTSRHLRIIGSREGSASLYADLSLDGPHRTIVFKSVSVDSRNFIKLLEVFAGVSIPPSSLPETQAALTKHLATAIGLSKVKHIDLFALSLFADDPINGIAGEPYSLSQLLEGYCRKYIRQRIRGEKSPNDLLSYASLLAFEFQVERTKFQGFDGEELILWDLVQSHSRVCDYLTAYYVANEFIGLSHKELLTANKMRYVYPHRINRLTKDLINKDAKKQIEFSTMVSRLIFIKRIEDYAKAQACYLAGRLTDPQAKRIALDALSNFKNKFMNNQRRRFVRGWSDGIQRDLKKKNDRLLLERTIYLSLAYLGDHKAEADYIDLLFDSPIMDQVNRGFHLEYYGDQKYDPTQPLTNLDMLQSCPKTFRQLLQNLAQGMFRDPLFEVEVHTLCSLAQKRHEIGVLSESDSASVIQTLNAISDNQSLKHNRLQIYVRMLKKHLSIRPFNVGVIVSRLYGIKSIKRSGWIRREIADGESVADHSYGAYLLGLLLLPDYLQDQPDYSKQTILDMLLVHDLAEAITGDVLPERSDEKSKRMELEVYEEIGLYGTYEGLADMSRTFLLWNEFEARQTLNAKIAKELDKIDNLVQLSIYNLQYKINDVLDWRDELREVVKTDVGKSLLDKLGDMVSIANGSR